MEVLFLSKTNLDVLDYGYATDNFNIIIDNVVPQASSFEINKDKINAEIGDYLVIKDKSINYIGIITSLEVKKDEYVTEVKTTDFISILDLKVKLKSYSGNLSIYLSNLIRDTFVNNSDPLQNLKYLIVCRDAEVVNGALTFEANTIDSISSVISTLNKAYFIGVKYNLVYEVGMIKGIELHISKCTKGLKLKSNIACIKNLVISDNNSQTVNKVLFVPKDENITYKNEVAYYLLTDGSISTNKSDTRRFKQISSITKLFGDNDYNSLSTTAQKEMLMSSLEHSIVFDYLVDNEIAKVFKDIEVGDFIEFITPNKTYQTMVTKLSFKGTLYLTQITLGEYRVSLTEKLKLLTRK